VNSPPFTSHIPVKVVDRLSLGRRRRRRATEPNRWFDPVSKGREAEYLQEQAERRARDEKEEERDTEKGKGKEKKKK